MIHKAPGQWVIFVYLASSRAWSTIIKRCPDVMPYLAFFSSYFKFRIISTIHIFEKKTSKLEHFRMPVATVIQAYSSFLIIGALIGFMKRGAVQPLIVALVIAIVGFYAAGIENKHPKR